jgi:hypothetical protein
MPPFGFGRKEQPQSFTTDITDKEDLEEIKEIAEMLEYPNDLKNHIQICDSILQTQPR